MDYTKIIFIDPATNFGWAIREVSGAFSQDRSGSHSLPKQPGPRVIEFWNKLDEIIKGGTVAYYKDTFVAWEESAFTGFSKADRMYGMWEGLLILFCELHKIPYLAVSGSRIKGYIGHQGFYLPLKERKLLPLSERKPKPRPEWTFTCEKKMLEHEIDSRWGLEYLIKEVLE